MLEACAVSVSVRGKAILDGIDLAIAPGAVTAVVGPNGAGKSTLLGVMAGGRRPTGGRVLLHGREIAAWTPRGLAAMRAVLSQSPRLAFAFTVGEVARLGLDPSVGMRGDGLVAEALALVGLGGMADRDCMSLSGGEQRRVHLARVLIQLRAAPPGGPARYLLLDEPTAGLDLAHQLLVVDIARDHAAGGGAVLVILHDLNLAAIAADRVVVLDRGRVAADGPPDAVITDRLLAEVYGVPLKVNVRPAGVFVLPARG